MPLFQNTDNLKAPQVDEFPAYGFIISYEIAYRNSRHLSKMRSTPTPKSLCIAILSILGLSAATAFLSCRHAQSTGEDGRADSPSAEEGIEILKSGNARFVSGKRKFARLDRERINETALAQKPFATILACSDSRVPVESVFDAGIGELFVVRVAGNVCSDHEVGSIEYAVEHLKTPLVVVLGHTYCGAVTAVVEHADVRGKFPHLSEHIMPAYEQALAVRPHSEPQGLIDEAIRCNVRKAIGDISRNSPGIRSMLVEGRVKIVGAIYDLKSGTVEWLPEPHDTDLGN